METTFPPALVSRDLSTGMYKTTGSLRYAPFIPGGEVLVSSNKKTEKHLKQRRRVPFDKRCFIK